ncbi:MAG: acetamidase/formamidase family protein [Anaerolineae bacterium]
MGARGPRAGPLNTIPPRENGGNIDITPLHPGVRPFPDSRTPGALFSCGDATRRRWRGQRGIETPMTVTLKITLCKGMSISELRFITPPGKKLTGAGEGGYYVATAHGPDLFKNAQQPPVILLII